MATSLTTGATPVSLDSITVQILNAPLPGSIGFTVSIHADASGSPGLSLATLTGDSAPVGGYYDYRPAAPFTLAANTTYWLVLSVPHAAPDKGFQVDGTGDFSQAGETGFSIGDSVLDHDFTDGIANGPWTIGSSKDTIKFAMRGRVLGSTRN